MLENIKKGIEVFPGMELSTGIDNLQDVARLRGLGLARSKATEVMHSVYKNTGVNLDRRHFELLSRAAHKYCKIEKAPAIFPFLRGEVVEYNKLMDALKKIQGKALRIDDALHYTLLEPVLDISAGTHLNQQVIDHLKKADIKTVKVTDQVEVSPVTTPLTRVVNQSTDWLHKLNHRYLKQTLKEGAQFGHSSNIHGYSPISAYAYGVEMNERDNINY